MEYKLIIKEMLRSQIKNLVDLAQAKRRIAKKFHLPTISNIKLLKLYHDFCKVKRLKPNKKLENLLKKRRVRSLSGIAVVSVLTKPYPCPGKCLYCPTEKGMPKSYLSNEPAVMRAVLNDFDPEKQIKNRLDSLELQGHPTDKVELIVIGGTWSYLPRKYQEWFIKKCFDSCNKEVSENLESAQKINERAKHRIIGITIETRPDFINEKEILHLRKLGVTRVELGVQSIYDDVLKKNLRGHKIAATIKATKLLKDAGFKICYHLMPNLPGSNLKRDEKMFREVFRNSDFQPDLLKIYPCAVLKEAPLYKLWKSKKYKPYSDKQLIDLLKKIKKKIPYYCRIQRLVRDIPSNSIIEGPAKISNLRQILAQKSKKEGWCCKCIRCREVRENYKPGEKLFLFRQDYKASGGKEIFLSYESKNRERLYSLLRLRIPSAVAAAAQSAAESKPKDARRPLIPALRDAAIIRELHTYGQLHPLKTKKAVVSPQHKGLGKKLIKKVERIVRNEFRLSKIAVISGIGARGYYRKLNYKLKESYMVKEL